MYAIFHSMEYPPSNTTTTEHARRVDSLQLPPGNPMIIDLHHAEPAELRQRRRDLEDQFEGREGIEIVANSSRNAFLAGIANRESDERSIALIDLRSETGDIEHSGLRIIQTIRRNPAIASRTVPVIWTDHVSNSNVAATREVGAAAMISDAWVDEAKAHELSGAIDRVAATTDTDGFLAFPPRATTGSLVEDPDDAARAEAFERWFGFGAKEIHFHLLWGMANAVELEFLKEYLAEVGIASSTPAAKGQLERLQLAIRPDIEALDRPESGNPEVARRFLAELMPPDFDPLPELNWPRLATVQTLLLEDPIVVENAFLTDETVAMLELFLSERRPVDVTQKRPKGSEIYLAIEDAVDAVAKAFGQPSAVTFNTIHHAAHSIDDAYWDLRRHGTPDATKEPTTA